MPMYEYECRHCGRRFERIELKFSDDTHTVCECGEQAERLMSAPAIQFKGTGWYVTDYAKKSGSRDKQGRAGDGSVSGDKGSESKSESKPAESKSSDSKPAPKP